jgi:photosystem II stability/assembly factor-like uncharacterized protein
MAIAGSVFLGARNASKRNLTGEWTIFAESELIHGSRISRVMFFDPNNGIIVSPGFIARSNDGGKQWTRVHASAEIGYYSFAFSNAQNGIAVGSVNNEVPAVLRTSDAGQSWHTLSFDPNALKKSDARMTTLLDVCFDSSGRAWISGNKGVVSAVVDEDKLNITTVHPTSQVLYSVACTENGQIWAVGEDAILINSGEGWQEKHFDNNYFGKVKSIGKDVWLLGRNKYEANSERALGVIWRSSNSGSTWENKTPESTGPIYDIIGVEGMLWIVGAGGEIYSSRDNGDSWLRNQSPTNADLLGVYILDNKNGWITGDRGTVLGYRK